MRPADAEERLHRVGRSVDRLRRRVESGADPVTLLHASSSARWELVAARRVLRIEQATRRLPDALGGNETARRAREELVDLVFPRRPMR